MKKMLFIPVFFMSSFVFSQEMNVHKTDGTVVVFNISEISHLTFAGTSGINELKIIDVTSTFNMLKNYPNPFSNSTTINYVLQEIGKVEVELVDLAGRIVKTFPPLIPNPGEYSLTWNCLTNSGSKALPGIYFCSIRFNNQVKTNRMILIN